MPHKHKYYIDPYLFTLVTNELTKHIQVEVGLCMLFADDIVFVHEIQEGVNTQLDIKEYLRKILSRVKTECMESKF